MSARPGDTAPRVPDPAFALQALLDPNHPLKTSTSEWARETLESGDRVARDRDSVFDRDGWERCARYGIQGAMVPAAYGGRGQSTLETLLILEGLGHGCRDNGLVFGIASQMLSVQQSLARVGSEEQKRRWLPGLVSGELFGAFAISEPDSGSDSLAMSARAERLEDGSYRLNANKCWLTFGPLADVAVVFANANPDVGAWGVTAFAIDMATPGVERGVNREKMGMRTTPFGDIRIRDAIIPGSDRLGEEGAGMGIFSRTMEAERALLLAGQLGAMERQLEDTVRQARGRKQFGRPIGSFQSVSGRIADMKVRHETARLAIYKAAVLQEAGRHDSVSASIAKLVTSEAAIESGADALRIFGAKGYVSEFEVDRDLRDAYSSIVASGTSDILRGVIAKFLGVG